MSKVNPPPFDEYQIMDTPQETSFDGLVSLAAAMFKTPLASICFMNHDRNWMKATFGIERGACPRELSICFHVVSSAEPLVVSDTHLDPRFKDNIFVTDGPQLRFYAGVPLISHEGFALGTLCVGDKTPRKTDNQQMIIFRMLAAQAVYLLEKSRAEKQLLQQNRAMLENSRLAILGKWTAEIIHEINNPLTVLQTRAGFLLMEAKRDINTRESTLSTIESILKTTHRMSKIIRSVQSFSRHGAQEPFENVSVAALIENSLSFSEECLKSTSIELQKEAISEDLQIYCRSGEISQVILNLMGNSIDAVCKYSQPWIKIETKALGDQVEIQITDCGLGIAAGTLDKIFYPFFTTKGIGKGTGLGLSISKNIVEAHGGTLRYAENDGHTSFVISLPKAIQLK